MSLDKFDDGTGETTSIALATTRVTAGGRQ